MIVKLEVMQCYMSVLPLVCMYEKMRLVFQYNNFSGTGTSNYFPLFDYTVVFEPFFMGDCLFALSIEFFFS